MAFGSGKRRRSEDDEDILADGEDIDAGEELEEAINVEEEEEEQEPPCQVFNFYHAICLTVVR
jgi:hypothetical protein